MVFFIASFPFYWVRIGGPERKIPAPNPRKSWRVPADIALYRLYFVEGAQAEPSAPKDTGMRTVGKAYLVEASGARDTRMHDLEGYRQQPVF
jgi:hypothetical protein